MAGSHVLFRKHSPSSMTKCLRKAALCHIEHKNYALASTVIRRCSANEAATHYVVFLTALHQGSCRIIHSKVYNTRTLTDIVNLAIGLENEGETVGHPCAGNEY